MAAGLPGPAVIVDSLRDGRGDPRREPGRACVTPSPRRGRSCATGAGEVARRAPTAGEPSLRRTHSSPGMGLVARSAWTARAVGGPDRRGSIPGRVLAVGLLLAVLGWVADTQTSVQSDVTKLVPSNTPALQDLHTLEHVTGVSGEIDVVVGARDVATPKTIAWMVHYEDTLLAHYGYLETKGCSQATLCPALSLPDLFCSGRPDDPEHVRLAQLVVDQRAAGRRPLLLQGGGDHARPARGLAGLRNSADAAGPPAAGDRIHALAAQAARPGSPPSWPGCPCWPRRPTPICPRSGAACSRCWSACWPWGWSCWPSSAALEPGAGPADPDRPGHRLVGPDRVPDRDPAQSALGRAGRARDRRVDRVQRAAVRALPSGARRRARPVGARCRGPTGPPGGR